MKNSLKFGAALIAVAASSGGAGLGAGALIGENLNLSEQVEALKKEKEETKLALDACREIVGAQAADLHERVKRVAFEPCSKEQMLALEDAAQRAKETEERAQSYLLESASPFEVLPSQEEIKQIFDAVDDHYAYCPKESIHTMVLNNGAANFSDTHLETTLAATFMPEAPGVMASVNYYPETFASPCELAASRVHESAHIQGFGHAEENAGSDWIYQLDQITKVICEEQN